MVDVADVIDQSQEYVPHPLKKETKPWSDKMLQAHDDSKRSDEVISKVLHVFAMKCMFSCKKGIPDVEPGAGFLAVRHNASAEQDVEKLTKLLGLTVAARNDVPTLEADDSHALNWRVDAAFVVHSDMKIYTGSIFTSDEGSISSGDAKQKRLARSSVESELNGTDEHMSTTRWIKKFIECQDYKVDPNNVFKTSLVQ